MLVVPISPSECDIFRVRATNTDFNPRDERRETVGIFLMKPIYRQAENQYLMVPPEKAKRLSPQAQRLLGYGICPPALGFYEYQDPMRVLFGVEDDETIDM
jgi:hypothetical protein